MKGISRTAEATPSTGVIGSNAIIYRSKSPRHSGGNYIRREIQKSLERLVPGSSHSWIGTILQELYVLRLEALGATDHVELDRLAFLEAPETVRLNRRKVHEDVFAILAADKTKSLCVVKPLHCSLFHFVFYLFLFVLNFLLRRSDATESGTRK